VKLIPDGAALFTRGMGMSCMWDSERGFGERSWRYSCVIQSYLTVEKIFIEAGAVIQNSAADPFEVSNAETMLAYLKNKQQHLSSSQDAKTESTMTLMIESQNSTAK
jgi:peroxiredoxin